ncbi:MAG TPA: Sir2 family NAD-dependent protein deacetylase [Candidatus Absconditabacterales bacterium]|nr:Sir2 family NAD-dependent protein deacetylase [Candidatus Absconditabacterales bacterium]HMT26792.1 Sir2 family NAD-dependent protein deacetylase [Candidatus Absconditabacterales bacterium]
MNIPGSNNIEIEKKYIDLFSSAKLLSEEKLKNMKENLEGEHIFTFSFRNKEYSIGYVNGKPFISVEISAELRSDLSEVEKNKFQKNEKKWYFQNFGELPLKEESEIQEEYIVSDSRRIFPENQLGIKQLRELSLNECVTLIKNKKILLYTGAGISIASGIHDMKTLKQKLGININEDNFLRTFAGDPEKAFEPWQHFIYTSKYNSPTKAHYALKEISKKLGCQIFTENSDFLQKNTGIEDLPISGPWIRKNISPEQIKKIDYILTFGLSFDDRGFLYWYKKINPNGKIIAFNLSKPSYLGKEDFLLKGDIQETIVKLNYKIL